MPLDQNLTGTFYGIGVGSGDPELLTLKAINALKRIDVLIAPKTEKKIDSVALSIAQPHLNPHAEIIFQTFPMVKDFEKKSNIFKVNQKEILKFLREGKEVGFVTLGDPMLYSTYIYIFRLLNDSGAKIVTIPGVPAFLAIAAQIGRPLASGNDILTIIPATAEREKIDRSLSSSDTTILMKVYKNFSEIIELLSAQNMLNKAILVSRSGLDNEKVFGNLSEHKTDKLNYLSTILTRRDDD